MERARAGPLAWDLLGAALVLGLIVPISLGALGETAGWPTSFVIALEVVLGGLVMGRRNRWTTGGRLLWYLLATVVGLALVGLRVLLGQVLDAGQAEVAATAVGVVLLAALVGAVAFAIDAAWPGRRLWLAVLAAALTVTVVRGLATGVWPWMNPLGGLPTWLTPLDFVFGTVVVAGLTLPVLYTARRLHDAALAPIAEGIGPYLRIMGVPLAWYLLGYCVIVVWFAGVFSLAYTQDDNAFRMEKDAVSIPSGTEPGRLTFGDFFYFSIMTFPPLGYSQIHPALPGAKMLVALESIAGVGWTVVVFAAIVAYLQPEFSQLADRPPKSERQERIRAILKELQRVARAKETTTYDELGPRVGLSMRNKYHRREMVDILNEISGDEHVFHGRPMLPAVVVVHRDYNPFPGESFFQQAEQLGRWRQGADTRSWSDFYLDELNAVYAAWK